MGAWGECDPSSCAAGEAPNVSSIVCTLIFTETRPIQCYKKLAHLDEEEAQLQFCRFTEDLCVYAELMHEDGEMSLE